MSTRWPSALTAWLFVSGGEQSHVALWDSSTGTLLKRLESPRISVTALVFHPDGKLVIGATRQKTVFVWNISEEQPAVRWLRGHTEEVRAVAIFPNMPQIVSGGWDCTLRVWDLETGREVRRIELDVRPESQVRSVAVTSKDTNISGHRDGQIRIWKTGHDEPVKFLSGHEEGVTDLAFHPDGSLLASASMDRTLRLWDTRTWEFKSTLTGHDDEIHSIAWSPDGSRIVSASLDHTVMLWSPTRAEHVLALYDNSDIVCGVAWSSNDGSRIVSGGINGVIRIWETDLTKARALWRAAAKQPDTSAR